MVFTAGSGNNNPRLVRIIAENAAGFVLSPDAQRIIDKILGNGSAALESVPTEERDAALDDLARQLSRAASEVREQLLANDIHQVSGDVLASILDEFCPFPPFCMGGSTAELIGTDDSDDMITAAPEAVPAG
jgi:hypothetical protein